VVAHNTISNSMHSRRRYQQMLARLAEGTHETDPADDVWARFGSMPGPTTTTSVALAELPPLQVAPGLQTPDPRLAVSRRGRNRGRSR
jgi:hypothetical protein